MSQAAESRPAPSPAPLPFVQPKPILRWLGVLLSVLGWYVSWQAFRVSAGAELADPLLRAACGIATPPGGPDACTAVLTSPRAYLRIRNAPGVPPIPTALLGLAYFAFVALWWLFVGPPTPTRRGWHLLVGLVVLAGAGYSAWALRAMAVELQRWCPTCLTAHGLNALLILITVLAWPWGRRARPIVPHPSTRLALATLVAGVFLVLAQTTITFARLPELSGQRARIAQMENDPAFIRWDYARQAPLEIPLHPDEVFAGAPDAPNTIVSFSDFLCRHCRRTHEIFPELLKRHPELRIAFRHYPLDAQCSANPALQIGGHAGACQAARAVEAARQLGGRDKYLALRGLLWKRQDELAAAGQRAAAAPPVRDFLIAAAAELGLDRDAFAEALDSAAVSARVQADVQTADRLGVSELPAVFLNGRRVRNWGRAETYDVLLAGRESQPAASQP